MGDEQRRQLEHDFLSGKRDIVRGQNAFHDELNIHQTAVFSKVQHESSR